MSFFKRLRQDPTMQDLTKKMVLSVVKTRAFPSWKQWQHLPRTLKPKERQLASGALLVMILSLLFLGGRYIVVHQTLVPAVGGEYSEALIGTPQLINPLYASLSDVDADLSRLIFSGLMKYDPKDGLVLDLAESYDLSDDGLTYTFVLRENARWHNGDPVTVNDVVTTFSMMQDPSYKSPLSVTFKDVRVEEVDERTVQFVLTEPFSPFLSALTAGIIPGQIWDFVPAKNATLAEANLQPLGSGPYKFDKFSKDRLGNIRSYTLVRNQDYYDESAKISRLTFRFYPDAMSAVDALSKKNVDGVSFVPSEAEALFARDRDVTLLHPLLPQYTALFFNQVRNSLLKDLDVRQALAMAIDRQALVATVLNNEAKVVDTAILPGMIGASDNVKEPGFDFQAAKASIEAVKAKLPADSKLALTLTTIDNPEFTAVAEFVRQAWSALGIEVTIVTVGVDKLQSEVLKERSYDVLLSGELLGADPDPYPFWHSSQVDYPGLNIALYANRDADKLIEKARAKSDPAARAEAYQQFQALLNDELPAIFLYQPSYTYAISSTVKGVEIPAILTPADRFAQINKWYLKTKRVLR